MIIDEQKRKAIELLAVQAHKKTEIAEMVGVSRQTLYNWMEDEKFIAELDSLLQKIKLYGEQTIKANLDKHIKNVVTLANSAESEKIKLEANMYLIDKVMGRNTTKIDLEATAKQVTINDDILEQEFKEFEE